MSKPFSKPSPARHVFRFAPSPNGYLHLGHAYSALLNYDMAQKTGGRLLVRIEDIDPTRCRPEYEIAIRQDLEWLGILFERPVRRQSEYFSDYRAALMRLEEAGLLFTSFETRNEIAKLVAARGPGWPHDPDGSPLYPGNARGMTSEERVQRIGRGEPYALRLDLAAALERLKKPLFWHETGEGNPREIEAHPERWGDVVLGRKETPASYHLACVLDDALQGVTHVVRGMDLYESTSIHRLLQEILGLPAPVYHHHKLILDEDGKKLAKRTRSTTLRDLRVQGWSAKDVRQRVGL
jgi:glutamyl-Q tRNA(Asp) synthetase